MPEEPLKCSYTFLAPDLVLFLLLGVTFVLYMSWGVGSDPFISSLHVELAHQPRRRGTRAQCPAGGSARLAPDSLGRILVEDGQVGWLSLPSLALRVFFFFLKSRGTHSWDSTAAAGRGGTAGPFIPLALLKTELFICAHPQLQEGNCFPRFNPFL